MFVRILIASFVLVVSMQDTHSETPPPTKKQPVVDDYHGVEVSDDYRWLEDWQDPQVRNWSNDQNNYARDALKQLPYPTCLTGGESSAVSGGVEEVGWRRMEWNAVASRF
jgi:hypothetical protein